MGNAVRITDNHIYGNATGISSDTLSAAGHPGFPADSSEIDHNYIYSNNLDLYRPRYAGRPAGGRADRHRDPLPRHERRPRPRQLHLRQLARRRDAVLGSGRATNGGGAEGDIFPGVSCPGAPANGSRPRAATSSSATAWAGRRTASATRMRSTCSATCTPTTTRSRRSRTATTSGGASSSPEHRELLVREHGLRRDRGHGHRSGPGRTPPGESAPGAAIELCHQRGQQRHPQDAYLLDCANGPDEDTGPRTATGGPSRPSLARQPRTARS